MYSNRTDSNVGKLTVLIEYILYEMLFYKEGFMICASDMTKKKWKFASIYACNTWNKCQETAQYHAVSIYNLSIVLAGPYGRHLLIFQYL